jgi:hypothetical protein
MMNMPPSAAYALWAIAIILLIALIFGFNLEAR